MPTITVNPTRMELTRLKGRLRTGTSTLITFSVLVSRETLCLGHSSACSSISGDISALATVNEP